MTANNRRRLDNALRGTAYENLPTLKQSAARITAAARDPRSIARFGRLSAANMASGEVVWEIFRQRQRQQQGGAA